MTVAPARQGAQTSSGAGDLVAGNESTPLEIVRADVNNLSESFAPFFTSRIYTDVACASIRMVSRQFA